METRLTRRTLLAAVFAPPAEDRLGVMCQLPPDEAGARKVLGAARDAGFRRVQINFPWTRVAADYLRSLPSWLKDANLAAGVLSAPETSTAPSTTHRKWERAASSRGPAATARA
jgi:hypothetical protein